MIRFSLRYRHLVAASILLLATCASAGAATVLLRDDFNGSSLDAAKWNVGGDGSFDSNRTYFGADPVVAGGLVNMEFATYNPLHAGTHFLGTDLFSKQTFPLGEGIEFEVRARSGDLPSGLVTSFFTWIENPNTTADEMDFEFLTNQINGNPVPPSAGQPVLVSTYNNWEGNESHYNDGVHHQDASPTVPGLDLTEFNVFTIRWLPDHTEWLVNGSLIASISDAHTDADTPVRMNVWAPDSSWVEAYDAALQPTDNPNQNQSYFYQIDYVEIRTVPEPSALTLAAVGMLGLLAWRGGAIGARERRVTTGK